MGIEMYVPNRLGFQVRDAADQVLLSKQKCYMPPAASGNDHISYNPRYSALSYVYITGKLRREGHAGLEMAGHYAAAGSYLMRMRRPGLARRYFAAARRITLKNPRLLTHLALNYLPGLHAWARGRSF